MLTRSKSVVGLDVGSNAVKAIELTQSGKDVVVTGVGQVEVPSTDPEAKSHAIKDLLAAGGFRTRRMVSAVSGKQVIVRYLSMVRMSDDELRNAITFEAEKYVPFPLEECVVDCQRVDGADDRRGGNMSVLMVAAKRSQLEEHIRTVGAAGITPEVIDVDSFALGNAFALCRVGSSELSDDGVIAFVDVGASKTSINVVGGGSSLFTREIALGGQDFTQSIAKRLSVAFDEAEDLKREPGENAESVKEAVFPAIDDLGNEIQLSFDYFENQFQKEIGSILLSGGGSRLSFFQASFERIFEKPTSLFNPFQYLKIDDGIDADLLSCNASQLVVATGLAARLQKA